MEKLWSGCLRGAPDAMAESFNSSIAFDSRMYRQDIAGSIAHANMLGKTGIIPPDQAALIAEGLRGILADIESGALEIGRGHEDIHSFVEHELTQKIGAAGKMLHTARSRNDQTALDLRMYLAEGCSEVSSMLKALITAITGVAEANLTAVMPGYTHMQRAQPVTLGHHLMAYAAMFLRDLSRLADAKKRILIMPLGSGALAGTTYPIDRRAVCAELGFEDISLNSIDGVSDRDFAIEAAFAMSMIMAHLSRLSEELILWCSWEFRFIELSDAYSTGSSIMPQKKNPDIAELARGKTGRVYGDLAALLTAVKGLPLAYNKDLQEDKEAVFDALDTVRACLPLFAGMISTMRIYPKNMRRAAAVGFINATDCADYLAKKGLPFRDAYRTAGGLVAWAADAGRTLETLTLEEYRRFSELFDDDVFEAVDLDNCVKRRNSEGGTSPESVARQISLTREALAGV
jgi:argininosuccinate lyase